MKRTDLRYALLSAAARGEDPRKVKWHRYTRYASRALAELQQAGMFDADDSVIPARLTISERGRVTLKTWSE